MRGKFISFEGPEGGGKSTHVAALAEALRAEGKSVLVTREPGGTRLAELIRGLVREELEDPPVTRAEVLLFLASRAQVVANVIKPALARGEWVLCDRFSDSTFAYQGYGRGIDVQLLKELNEFATEGLVPVVKRMTIDYHCPLRSGDVTLSCLWVERKGPRFIFYQDIFKKQGGEPVVSAAVTIVCLEKDGRINRGDDLAARLSKYFDKP